MKNNQIKETLPREVFLNLYILKMGEAVLSLHFVVFYLLNLIVHCLTEINNGNMFRKSVYFLGFIFYYIFYL